MLPSLQEIITVLAALADQLQKDNGSEAATTVRQVQHSLARA